MEACALEPDYNCNCTDGFIGKNCTEVVSNHEFMIKFILVNDFNELFFYPSFFLSSLYCYWFGVGHFQFRR